MATYFGEIIERSSRAFWDDEYDEEEDECLDNVAGRSLEVSSKNSTPITRSKLLLVIHGALTVGFAETCLLDKGATVAEIKETKTEENASHEKRGKKYSTTIHSLTNDVLICTCAPNLPVTQSFDFVEELSPWLKNTEQVMVLTCKYLPEYRGNFQSEQDSFLRALKTDSYKNQVLSAILEQPNTLTGIPAGILTYCQMSKIPAVVYVSYTHTFRPDSRSVKHFSDLVSKIPFKIMKEKPDFTRRLYSGAEESSNLYM